jgi:hypothetical protein
MRSKLEKNKFSAYGLGTLAIALTLTGCGGGGSDPGANPLTLDTSGERGALIASPAPTITFFRAAQLEALLTSAAPEILAVSGAPLCDLAVHKFEYSTVDGSGAVAKASAALMIPTALSDPANQGASCAGPRDIVLYAHGTTVEKDYNIANVADLSTTTNLTGEVNAGASEGALLGALFAAQGYVVIAPNFVGYDSSTTSYHPYVNHDQQAKDMLDSLMAGRKALEALSPTYRSTDSGKLFITGFSQGGSVAMATQKLMQDSNLSYTAAAPVSGAYQLTNFVDTIFVGNDGVRPLIPFGAPIFATMLIESYLNSYQLDVDRDDIYNEKFRTGIESLLPSAEFTSSTVRDNSLLPQFAVFEPTDPFEVGASLATPAFFDSTNFLIKSSFRDAYLANSGSAALLRAKVAENDLSGFRPTRPTFLCAGGNDPVVFTNVNHDAMETAFAAAGLPAGLVTTLDLQDPVQGNPFRVGFQGALAALTPQEAAVAYHSLVAPFCLAGARQFFSAF